MKIPDHSKPLPDPSYRTVAILASLYPVILLILAVTKWSDIEMSLQLFGNHYELSGLIPKLLLLTVFLVWFWAVYLLYKGSRTTAWLFLTLFVFSVAGQTFRWWESGEVANVNYAYAFVCAAMLAIGLKRQNHERTLSEYYAKRAAIRSQPVDSESSSG